MTFKFTALQNGSSQVTPVSFSRALNTWHKQAEGMGRHRGVGALRKWRSYAPPKGFRGSHEALRAKGGQVLGFFEKCFKPEYLSISFWRLKFFQKNLWAKTNIYKLNLSHRPAASNDHRGKILSFCFRAFAQVLYSASNSLLPFLFPSFWSTTLILLVFTQLPLLPKRISPGLADKMGSPCAMLFCCPTILCLSTVAQSTLYNSTLICEVIWLYLWCYLIFFFHSPLP